PKPEPQNRTFGLKSNTVFFFANRGIDKHSHNYSTVFFPFTNLLTLQPSKMVQENNSLEIQEPSPKIQKLNQQNGGSSFLKVKKLSENAILPSRGSSLSAGYDLSSAVETKVPARGKALVPTDLSIAIPEGTYARIAPRSGLAWKHSINVGAGVIDADYRGPVGVILFNHSDVDFEVKAGDRIAQMILEKIVTPEVFEVEDLDSTVREYDLRGGWPLRVVARCIVQDIDPNTEFGNRRLEEGNFEVHVNVVYDGGVVLPLPHDDWRSKLGECHSSSHSHHILHHLGIRSFCGWFLLTGLYNYTQLGIHLFGKISIYTFFYMRKLIQDHNHLLFNVHFLLAKLNDHLVWKYNCINLFADRSADLRDLPKTETSHCLGFITSLTFIFLVGVFMSSWWGASVLGLGEWFIKKMPFVSYIYTASKQISAAISPDQTTHAFKEVALIRHPCIGEHAFGFITSTVILRISAGEEELCCVYIPSNHLYIGDIFLVHSNDIMRPNLSVREGIEIVISGGMSIPQILTTIDAEAIMAARVGRSPIFTAPQV
ncbi:hypothetical protein IFM89_029707, partial [Coptis chinensis]